MISAPHSPLHRVLSLDSETSWKLETEVLFWTGFFFFSRTMDGGGEGGAGSEFSQEPQVSPVM